MKIVEFSGSFDVEVIVVLTEEFVVFAFGWKLFGGEEGERNWFKLKFKEIDGFEDRPIVNPPILDLPTVNPPILVTFIINFPVN